MKRQPHNMGTISHGTMRPEDLIPTFTDWLESQKPLRREHRKMLTAWKNEDEYDGETFLEDLFDALGEYAPPYFYFGAHPGDGSDYGYWLSDDFQNEFEGLQVEDLTDVPRGYTGEVLHVNDHGNMTLYRAVRGRLYEIWAIV